MRLSPGSRCFTKGCEGRLMVLHPVPTSGPGALHCSHHPMPSHEERMRLAMLDEPWPVTHTCYWWGDEGAAASEQTMGEA
jgi:hypothetical protein